MAENTVAADTTTALAASAPAAVPEVAAAAPIVATSPEVKDSAAAADPFTTATTTDTEKSPLAQLWSGAQSHGHPEIWGVPLSDPETHIPSQVVFQKYLNANDGDLVKAKEQLISTLDWRAKTKPIELAHKAFNKKKFEGLGYVTTYVADEESEPEHKEVFTWNQYGSVKSIDETFGDLEEFINWRVALMEIALLELGIAGAVKRITADYDPYKIYQVHDYRSISFLRSPPIVRSASSETIKVFAQNYPELLKEKFFVNVPAIMGFVYSFMKLFVAAKTIKKFHPMSNGGNLAQEFAASGIKGLGEKLPVEYGGKGGELKVQGKETLLE
ncbi:phosphatidylinositol transfer protein SFH5 [Podospora fimiseda]|uniref:Phosphatidylinositol transfer protein SFH5 n=1 Tax=Podospora fimiseda TaxID=252190 RepID=A0AAN7BEA9_9PEZI|nr:phosphatidylinositol transfer protein SFH5 [Podospora fimiseda]